jgi:peptidoglycan/xylan/chitin deacetylase (PgdA/CDA1 family)
MAGRSFIALMYHELELSGRPLRASEAGYKRYILPEQDFRTQVQYLKASNFQGLSLGQALTFPEGLNVAITFDDGCETDLLSAAPILREAAFGATFYVTTGWVGNQGYLSASQIKELKGQGFEIGCHSMTHAFLTDLEDKGLKREIVDAKSLLEQISGGPVDHFSCPGGRHNHRVAAVVRAAGYRTMATSLVQANFTETNLFALGRVAIRRGMSTRDFANICSGDALWQVRAQSALRDAFKRMLGNSFYDQVRKILLGRRSAG